MRYGDVVNMLTGNALDNFARRAVFERLMRAEVVVKRQPDAQAPARIGHRIMRPDIDLVVFQAPPWPFDENIVASSPFRMGRNEPS